MACPSLTLAIGIVDLLVVYSVPVVLLAGVCLLVPLLVRVLLLTRLEFDFKYDLLHKYTLKRRLRSGRDLRLSYAYVAKLLLGDNCIQAAFLYRISRFLVAHRLAALAQVVHAFAKVVTHLDVSPHAEIGRGVYFYHGLGTVIGKGTRIGEGALICQGVTTAGGSIGAHVSLWAGAKVIGRVTIGDRSEVGANAVVVADVPADCIVGGIPARVLRTKDASGVEPQGSTRSPTGRPG